MLGGIFNWRMASGPSYHGNTLLESSTRSWVCEGCMQSLLQWYMQRENTSHQVSLPLWLGKWCGIYWNWSMHEKNPHIWKEFLWLPWLLDFHPLFRFRFMKSSKRIDPIFLYYKRIGYTSSCITRRSYIFSINRINGMNGWSNHHDDWAQTSLSYITQVGECLWSCTVSYIFVTYYSVKFKLGFQCSCKSDISSSGGLEIRCKW